MVGLEQIIKSLFADPRLSFATESAKFSNHINKGLSKMFAQIHDLSAVQNIRTSDEFFQDMKEACRWVKVQSGRATHYLKAINTFKQEECLTADLEMLVYECFDLVEIYRVWREKVGCFPGLKQLIERIFKKGSDLTDEHDSQKSADHSRNHAFSVLMAGRFQQAGFCLLQVEQHNSSSSKIQSNADFTLERNGLKINVECKRPTKFENIAELAKQASGQITKSNLNGVIALDCSLCIRPRHHVFENIGVVPASTQFLDWMQDFVVKELKPAILPEIMGIILYCRVPTITPIEHPGHQGDGTYRHDCTTSIMCIPVFGNLENIELMYDLRNQFHRSSPGIKHDPVSSL